MWIFRLPADLPDKAFHLLYNRGGRFCLMLPSGSASQPHWQNPKHLPPYTVAEHNGFSPARPTPVVPDTHRSGGMPGCWLLCEVPYPYIFHLWVCNSVQRNSRNKSCHHHPACRLPHSTRVFLQYQSCLSACCISYSHAQADHFSAQPYNFQPLLSQFLSVYIPASVSLHRLCFYLPSGTFLSWHLSVLLWRSPLSSLSHCSIRSTSFHFSFTSASLSALSPKSRISR